MEPLNQKKEGYLEALTKRAKESHAYNEHQLIGLQVADLLADRPHKALYIKLVKEWGKEKIWSLAKTVAENKVIKNKGAYFMRMLYGEKHKNKNGK